jgi:predicted CopG family antitoxin
MAKRVLIIIEDDVYEALKKRARYTQRSMSNYAAMVLKATLNSDLSYPEPQFSIFYTYTDEELRNVVRDQAKAGLIKVEPQLIPTLDKFDCLKLISTGRKSAPTKLIVRKFPKKPRGV